MFGCSIDRSKPTVHNRHPLTQVRQHLIPLGQPFIINLVIQVFIVEKGFVGYGQCVEIGQGCGSVDQLVVSGDLHEDGRVDRLR